MIDTVARRLVAALALTALLAACSSDDGGAVATDDTTDDTGAATTDATETTETEGGAGGAAEGVDAVDIVDFTFDPEGTTVAVGTTVTWTNQDEAVHSVADDASGFESADLAQGDTFTFTYDEAGTFPYLCGIHNYMEGTVTVE